MFFPTQKRMTDDELFEFYIANRDVDIERNPNGDIIINLPSAEMYPFQEKK